MPFDRPRDNNRPPRDDDRPSQPDRVHRVSDPTKPTGGPFGPPKKKKFPSSSQHFGPPRTDGPPRNDGGFRSDRPQRLDGPRNSFPRNDGPRNNGPRNDGPPRNNAPFRRDAPFTPRGPAPVAKKKTDWSDVAQWYDDLVGDEGSEFHREVVLPGTKKLLGNVSGKKILDVACGQGVLARHLAAAGAEVTAVDAAPDLLDAARARGTEAGSPVRYLLADATELKHIDDAAYDAAACLLAIQNIHAPQAVFTQVARTLRPGGTFTLVMMHPAFRSPKATHWGWLPDAESGGGAGTQFRRVDRYLIPRKEPILTHPGKAAHGERGGEDHTWSFHRPIGDYITFARKAGMMVDAMEEWPSHKTSTSGPRAPAENQARKEIPMFLALRCVKPGAPAAIAKPEVPHPGAEPSEASAASDASPAE